MPDKYSPDYVKALEQALSNAPCSVTYAFFDAQTKKTKMCVEAPFQQLADFIKWRDACAESVEVIMVEFPENTKDRHD